MATIDPKNLSAQLRYRAAGNPPTTKPISAIGNCFPGLEFDFRNIWRRILVGLLLHEADNLVVDIEPGAPPAVQALRGKRLVSVNGVAITTPVTGPTAAGGANQTLAPAANLEWTNSLAHVVTRPGSSARCVFQDVDPQTGNFVGQPIAIDLQVRALLEDAVISREAVQPGELTQSLCSPWQNDYLECGCYYWAAARPDFVNVDTTTSPSRGHNWLQKNRTATTPKNYFTRNLVTYEELFRSWPEMFKFVEKGNDRE